MTIDRSPPIALAAALLLIGVIRIAPANGAGQTAPDTGLCAGIVLSSVTIEAAGLASTPRPACVPLTPYNTAVPPTPTGLPQHVAIAFEAHDQSAVQPGAAALYIIPVDRYEALWADSGDSAVSRAMQLLRALLASQVDPLPTSGLPILPFERVTGTNDLAVQGVYPGSAVLCGVRFVGRFSQSLNPVTNVGMQYIAQGFSRDGMYLIAVFYPVTSSGLPASVAEVPSDEFQRVDSDPAAHMQEKAAQLNTLVPADWSPDLTVLDAMVESLRFEVADSATVRIGSVLATPVCSA